MRRLLLPALFLLLNSALGQQLGSTELFGVPYVSVQDLARGLGTEATRVGQSVVIRSGSGILTLFVGQQDYLWLPAGMADTRERRMAAPTVEDDSRLWVPLTLVEDLGGSVSGIVVILPDRTRLLLTEAAGVEVEGPRVPVAPMAAEQVELDNGVLALRLQHQGQSVLLVDAGLLALALPEQRAGIDEFNAGITGYRPLYFVLSSSAETAASLEFTFRQGDSAVVLGPDDGLVVLRGDPASVAPGRPLSGVLLLPVTTNLRVPLQVEWQDRTASMVFRR